MTILASGPTPDQGHSQLSFADRYVDLTKIQG